MDCYALEIRHIGGDLLLNAVRKEFPKTFHIVSRTPDDVVLGDGIKNVKFSRKNNRVLERHVFEQTSALERKR
jgi:hypothetical protein